MAKIEESEKAGSRHYMSRFANNALLGGGVRVTVGIREQLKEQKETKGTAKPLMVILDVSHVSTFHRLRPYLF